jgi:hypothetical protein
LVRHRHATLLENAAGAWRRSFGEPVRSRPYPMPHPATLQKILSALVIAFVLVAPAFALA